MCIFTADVSEMLGDDTIVAVASEGSNAESFRPNRTDRECRETCVV